MSSTWVVLVEAAGDPANGAIDRAAVERLLDALGSGTSAGILHSADRYALQVTTTSTSPVEALYGVLSRLTNAVRLLELPAWEVVRTEVLTPEELERDFQSYGHDAVPAPRPSPPSDDEDAGHELLRRAFSDQLTGLLSREAFEHQVEQALAESGAGVAVVCVDLDAFHRVNDRFGDSTGDHVLVRVAQRLASRLRPGDDLARLAGDEFAVLLDHSTEEAAVAVADRLLDTVRRPLDIEGHELALSASAGIASGHPGQSAREVLDKADAALSQAREGGRVLFGPATSLPAQPQPNLRSDPLQDRLAHLVLMQGAAVAANEADTLEEAVEVVLRQVCTHIGCGIGHLWTSATGASGQLLATSVWHSADGNGYSAFREATDAPSMDPCAGLVGRVWASGRPGWISEVAADPTFLRRDQCAAAGLESAFAFPVLIGLEVVAVLEFFSRAPMEPTGSFLDVVSSIGTQLGRVVERQRAHAALHRSEQRLRDSEARLRKAQTLARLGSWQFDLRSGEASWSDEMYCLYGLDATGPGLEFEAAMASVYPADRARAQAAMSRLVESGERVTQEVRVLRPDGQMRWHRSEGSVVRDETGQVVGIHGTSQDITESKLAEEALRERERQLSQAQRLARLGSWEHDLSTGQLRWSDEMCRLWGLETGSQPSFDDLLATIHTDDRPRVLEQAARLRQTGESICVEFRATVTEGRQRWFRGEAHLVRDEGGTPTRTLGTAQDITEEKQAAEELRATKEMYQRIVETAHEGILTIDAQDITTFVNPRLAQILGYSVEEMPGMPVSAFVHDETYTAMSGQQRRRRAGMSEHYETRLRTKGGAALQVLVSANPFFDEGGQYAGALAMISDITTLREAEAELRLHDLSSPWVLGNGQRGDEPAAL